MLLCIEKKNRNTNEFRCIWNKQNLDHLPEVLWLQHQSSVSRKLFTSKWKWLLKRTPIWINTLPISNGTFYIVGKTNLGLMMMPCLQQISAPSRKQQQLSKSRPVLIEDVCSYWCKLYPKNLKVAPSELTVFLCRNAVQLGCPLTAVV